jgi:hypothetical protein
VRGERRGRRGAAWLCRWEGGRGGGGGGGGREEEATAVGKREGEPTSGFWGGVVRRIYRRGNGLWCAVGGKWASRTMLLRREPNKWLSTKIFF